MGVGLVATIVQQRSLATRPTDWTDSVTLNQIDPATGVTSLTLSLGASLTTQVYYYNSDLAPGLLQAVTSAGVALGAPDGTVLAARPTSYIYKVIPAAGGAGAGGMLSASGSDSSSSTYVAGSTGATPGVLLGTGTVNLGLVATAKVHATAPGNVVADFFSQVGATVTETATTSGSGSNTGTGGSGITTFNPGFGASWRVDSAVQTKTFAPQITGWTGALQVGGFDPALGTLQAVAVSIIVNSGATFGVENLDPDAGTVTVGQSTAVSVETAAGTSLASQSAAVSTTRMLGAYDGTPDNAGRSGVTVGGLAGTGSNSQVLYDAATLAAFTGAGPVSLSAVDTGTTTIDGPANLEIATGLQAGATISVQYLYTPTVGALFDAGYYLSHNPDVAAAGVDPYQHYLNHGWMEGRDPSALFDTKYYLSQNPDVAASGMDPLLHFAQYGWKEGRDPSLLFSDAKYVAAYPSAAGADPLLEYQQGTVPIAGNSGGVLIGYAAPGPMTFLTGGTLPADPLVDAAYYDKQLGATLIPTGTAAAQQAAWSYDATGWQKGLSPDAFFDTNYYLSHNPDVAAAHVDPLLHYETYGWHEGRDPSAAFSTNKYLAAYSDVRASGVDPLLQFIQTGQAQGRTAFSA